MKKYPLILLVLVFHIYPYQLFAQTDLTELQIGHSFTLHSDILNQDRTIIVGLPDGYDTSKAHYPVIYLPDPEWNFKHVYGTSWYLANSGAIPQVIIVSVKNIDRNHDLLPTTFEGYGGGAEKFLSFFEVELIPYIEKNYRTTHFKVLDAGSFGGVFSLYTLLTKPHVFDAYFAISPALWWDNELIIKKSKEVLKKDNVLNKRLFISLANEENFKVEDFVKILKRNAPKGLEWKFIKYPDETHSSVGLESNFDGLRFIFAPSTSDK